MNEKELLDFLNGILKTIRDLDLTKQERLHQIDEDIENFIMERWENECNK